jgi:hypothetical protein
MLTRFIEAQTQLSTAPIERPQSGWSSLFSRGIAGILLFELITGLALTFGPFHQLSSGG